MTMKTPRVYLSIDLDYWSWNHTGAACKRFFDRVFALGIPMWVTPSHEQLLPYINDSGCQHIVNVDEHSDIVDIDRTLKQFSRTVANDGTWANFVSFRRQGLFEWRHPRSSCQGGYCHSGVNPFRTAKCAGWKQTKKRRGIADIPWNQVSAIGVCLSRDYMGEQAAILPVVRMLGICEWLHLHNEVLKQMPPKFIDFRQLKVA